MPDLTIEIMFMCSSNEYFETKVKGKSDTYMVYLMRGKWHCECKGFAYRATCEHVKKAEKKFCGWHQQVDGGQVKKTKDGWECPRCGGEAVPIRVAV
jgi:hypothetical protein